MFLLRLIAPWVRRYTRPKTKEEAEKWSIRLSGLYFLVSMNLCGYAYYRHTKKKQELQESGEYRPKTRAERWAKYWGKKDVTVLNFKNFTYTGSYRLTEKEPVEDETDQTVTVIS